MYYVAKLIAYILIFDIFITINSVNSTNTIENLNINDITQELLLILGAKTNDTKVNVLKEKLEKINGYVIDKEKYASLLKNVTTETELNQTDFFKALNEDDFKFISEPELKNVYLKMKEKMNRDDIMDILKRKGHQKKLIKKARRHMDYEYFDMNDKEVLDTVVDKVIAEAPSDDHTFDNKIKDSNYWDPKGELEEWMEFHKPKDGRRIFRGERSNVNLYPFMVSVHVMGRFWCGGTVYWKDLVITSAACLQLLHNNRFFRENPRVLQVRVGSNHSRIGGEMIDALEVYFYPSYNPRTLRNNIALIRLRRRMVFTYHHVPKLIKITQHAHALPHTEEVLVLGWGVTKVSQKMMYEPVFLQKKFLPVYPNNFCKEVYGDQFITESMFCAGTFTTGEGACDHDAGGPAIMRGRLVGIISFGPAVCGYPNAPTVFTHVGAFADWIETVNETMPNYYGQRVHTTTSTKKPLIDYLIQRFSDSVRSTRTSPTGMLPMMRGRPATGTSKSVMSEFRPTTETSTIRTPETRPISEVPHTTETTNKVQPTTKSPMGVVLYKNSNRESEYDTSGETNKK